MNKDDYKAAPSNEAQNSFGEEVIKINEWRLFIVKTQLKSI